MTETLDIVISGYRNSQYYRGWLPLHLQVERGIGRNYFDSPSRKTSLRFSVPPDDKGKSRAQNYLGFLASDDANCLKLQM